MQSDSTPSADHAAGRTLGGAARGPQGACASADAAAASASGAGACGRSASEHAVRLEAARATCCCGAGAGRVMALTRHRALREQSARALREPVVGRRMSASRSAPLSTCASSKRGPTRCGQRATQADPRRSLSSSTPHGAAMNKIYAIPETAMGRSTRWSPRSGGRSAAPAPRWRRPPSGGAGPRRSRRPRLHAPRLQMEGDAAADTHDFVPWLRRLDLARPDALRLAARRAPPCSICRRAAPDDAAAAAALPIMVVRRQSRDDQIHTGPVSAHRADGPLGSTCSHPDFNRICAATCGTMSWLGASARPRGIVTSVELVRRRRELSRTYSASAQAGGRRGCPRGGR